MKFFYSSLHHFNEKVILSFFLVLFLISLQQAKAQNPYRADSDSRIEVLIDSNENTNKTVYSLNAQGEFIIKDGKLDDVNSFNFNLPINKLSSNANSAKDSISFKLTHVMILPIMKKIHFVGVLNVAGVSSRTEIFFDFRVNNDQSITLTGDKFVKLNEYKQASVDKTTGIQDDIDLKLSMNLVLKNDPVMLLSSTGKSGSR
jgi:hypothetical protein